MQSTNIFSTDDRLSLSVVRHRQSGRYKHMRYDECLDETGQFVFEPNVAYTCAQVADKRYCSYLEHGAFRCASRLQRHEYKLCASHYNLCTGSRSRKQQQQQQLQQQLQPDFYRDQQQKLPQNHSYRHRRQRPNDFFSAERSPRKPYYLRQRDEWPTEIAHKSQTDTNNTTTSAAAAQYTILKRVPIDLQQQQHEQERPQPSDQETTIDNDIEPTQPIDETKANMRSNLSVLPEANAEQIEQAVDLFASMNFD